MSSFENRRIKGNGASQLVVVVGMHRSGTSMITHLLSRAGYFVGDDDLMTGNQWNKDGYFERWPVVNLNDEILKQAGGAWNQPPAPNLIHQIKRDEEIQSVLSVYAVKERSIMKDPRFCLTLPVWQKVLPEQTLFIYMERDQNDVAASLHERDGFTLQQGMDLWQAYHTRAQKFLQNRQVFRIRYEDLFSDARPEILKKLAAFLNLSGDLETMAAEVVDSKQRRQKNSSLISIIIPVFNQVAYTRKCLETLYRNAGSQPFEVIVVDNASTDETPHFLQTFGEAHPNFIRIRNERNLGFAGGCNTGAVAAKGRYLLFLNNDTEPQPGWLEEIFNLYSSEPNAGIIGAKLLYPDQTVQHAGISFRMRHVGGKKLPWPHHHFRGVHKNHSEVKKMREVEAVTGACLFIPKKLFESLGRLDENYHMYFEDLDLNMKVRQSGRRILYCPAAEVIHYEGKSSPGQEEIDRKNLASAEIFFERWGGFLEKEIVNGKWVKSEVLWSAPFFNPSGYASEAIHFALGLERYTHLQILHDNPLYSEEFVANMPYHWKETLFRLHQNDFKTSSIRINKDFIFISHQPAYSFKQHPSAKYNIGRSMFETDRIPDFWVPACNRMDEIWVPSRFNYQTFVKSGVEENKLKIIPEAIDTTVFDPNIVEPLELPEKAGFNFLSVFEWTERKGWEILLKAYFEAFNRDDDVCLYLRTFLMGHYDGDSEAALRQKISEFIKKNGYAADRLPRWMLLTRQLPFPDIPRLYKAVDAFVLPSRGEGWGRPYMEAMSMGLPVIGTDWSGNTEFMNPDNAYLIRLDGLEEIKKMELPFYIGHRWARPSKNHLKKLMRTVFENPAAARKKGEKARHDIAEKFSVDAVAQRVARRLQEIEYQLQQKLSSVNKAATRSTLSSQPAAVIWEGSQFVFHSLALVNRELTSRLIQAGQQISVKLHEPDQFKPDANSVYNGIIKSVNKKLPAVDVHVRHFWPPDLTPPERGHWVIIQPWEFGSLPRQWVEVFSQQVDEIWVPSHYVRQVYLDSGMPGERVFVVPNGVDPQKFNPDIAPYPLKTRKKFRFLFVGGAIYRKGIDLLLNAYLKAFRKTDDVCLVIKDFCGDSFYKGQTIAAKIKEIQQDPTAPDIEYIDDVLPEAQLAGLYTACDVLVHPYRGEGFGLPILEAMACGLPVMVTNGGACRDFCHPDNSILLDARKIVLPEKSIGNKETVDYPWLFEVNMADLIAKMKYAVAHPGELVAMGNRAGVEVRDRWNWDRAAEVVFYRIQQLKKMPVRREQRSIFEQVQKAEKWVAEGETEKARPVFDEILSQFNLAAAHYGLARCSHNAGKMEETIQHLQAAIDANPHLTGACILLGKILINQGNYPEAEKVFSRAISINPFDVSLQREYARLLANKNDWENAIQAYKAILKNHPGDLESLKELLEIYRNRNQNEHALKTLYQMVNRHTDNREIWYVYLDAIKEMTDKIFYMGALNQYLKKFPDDPVMLNKMGVQLWESGEADAAIRMFEAAVVKNGHHPENLKNLADAYLQKEQFDQAVRLYYLLINQFPEDPEAYEKLALLYIENGDYATAAQLLQQALNHQPDNQYFRDWLELLKTPKVYLGYHLINQGELELATEVFKEFLKEEPHNIAAQLGMGSILFHQNRVREAENIYRQILQIDPENSEALHYLEMIAENGRDSHKA